MSDHFGTWCIKRLEVSIIILRLLISYSLWSRSTQMWILYSLRKSLSGEIELDPGPKRNIDQCFSSCHWNLNSVASHNFWKIQSVIAYSCIHKFEVIYLWTLLKLWNSLSSDNNLQIPGYNFLECIILQIENAEVCACTANQFCLWKS